jgi:deoxyribodipyrimidine photolyase-related protein
MLLCEIQPGEMYRWFSELCLDSYDWTIVPSIYGGGLFASGAVHGVLPVYPSQSIMDASPYEHGDWADIWDGLFWRFVEKHETMLAKDPHTRHWVGQLHKLEADYKRIIHYRAEDFLNQHTTL